jgi:hypothetical protein
MVAAISRALIRELPNFVQTPAQAVARIWHPASFAGVQDYSASAG